MDPDSSRLAQRLRSDSTLLTNQFRRVSVAIRWRQDPYSPFARWTMVVANLYRRLMQEATQAAPKPLSMLTTVTLEAQELSMPRSAATPPKLAP
jgi:hypothetical protein